jgi:hypothetical protein
MKMIFKEIKTIPTAIKRNQFTGTQAAFCTVMLMLLIGITLYLLAPNAINN